MLPFVLALSSVRVGRGRLYLGHTKNFFVLQICPGAFYQRREVAPSYSAAECTLTV